MTRYRSLFRRLLSINSKGAPSKEDKSDTATESSQTGECVGGASPGDPVT